MDQKKRVFSGIQPSGGAMTLGNYFGAIKNWVDMQDDYDCIYSVVDMHAITVQTDASKLRSQTLDVLAQIIACGLDPAKNILFIQSHVPQHAELAWVLGCYTMFGELSRMTQFKDKSSKNPQNINSGLFTYPTLQAADIILYDTDLVPVGEDQRQHLELARNIVQRFNGLHGDVLRMPELFIPKVGAKIMSLQEPTQKMSKSDPNPGAFVLISDSQDEIMRKFKRAVTDSGSEVRPGDDKPGVTNLMTIYCAATGKTTDEAVNEFAGKGYGDFKAAVGEAVAAILSPIRERAAQLSKDKAQLEAIYRDGAARAEDIARRVMRRIAKKIGYVGK